MKRLLWAAAAVGAWGCREASLSGAQHPLGEGWQWWLEAAGNSASLVFCTSLGAVLFATPLGLLQVVRERSGHTRLSGAVLFLEAIPTILWVGILRLWDPSNGVLALAGALFMGRGLEVARVVAQSLSSCLEGDRGGADRAMGVNVAHRLRYWALPQLVPAVGVTVLEGAAASTLTEACLSVLGLGFPLSIPTLGAGLLPRAGAEVFAASVVTLAALWWLLRAVPVLWTSRLSPKA